MALEQMRVQIAMLMDEIASQPEDAHQLQEAVREKLSEMRALGLPLPDDLVALEAELDAELETTVPQRAPAEDAPPQA